jgi:hypothetical protein
MRESVHANAGTMLAEQIHDLGERKDSSRECGNPLIRQRNMLVEWMHALPATGNVLRERIRSIRGRVKRFARTREDARAAGGRERRAEERTACLPQLTEMAAPMH